MSMIDHEEEDRKEWQGAEAFEARSRRHIIKPILFNADNPGEASWRRKAAPNGIFTLPKEFTMSVAPQRGRAPSEGSVFPELRAIAEATQTMIEPSARPTASGELILQLWGTEESVDEAKEKIKEWIDPYTSSESRKSRNWAKINSITPEMLPKVRAQIEEEARKAEFKRAPPADVILPASATFDWPSDYDRPDLVAGKSLEAYDSLRTGMECYITYDPHKNTINLMGADFKKVRKAMLRVRSSYFGAVSRDRPATVVYLIQPFMGDQVKSRISLTPYTPNKPQGDNMRLPVFKGERLKVEERVERESQANDVRRRNTRKLKAALDRTSQTLRYYKATVRFRARMGQFVLTRFKKEHEQSLDYFDDMMDDEQVKGKVANDLNFSYLLLSQVVQHPELFTPASHRQKLEDVTPVYIGSFVMEHRKDSAILKLDVAFELDRDGEPFCQSKAWASLNETGDREHSIMNVCIADIAEKSAWALEMLTEDPVQNNRMPSLHKFADTIKMPQPKTQGEHGELDHQFVDYAPIGELMLQSLHLIQTWRYNIKGTLFTLEISKVHELSKVNPDTARPNQKMLKTDNIHWTVNVTRPEWSSTLAQNIRLGIGEKVEQQLREKDLFPEGVKSFTDILDKVRQAIHRPS
ncbi:MAG: hypothetical protein M1831_006968 [Alyxoria varia]|nr:MAG: hypothetical protein M1831_006968 [Alyxoria varia]